MEAQQTSPRLGPSQRALVRLPPGDEWAGYLLPGVPEPPPEGPWWAWGRPRGLQLGLQHYENKQIPSEPQASGPLPLASAFSRFSHMGGWRPPLSWQG